MKYLAGSFDDLRRWSEQKRRIFRFSTAKFSYFTPTQYCSLSEFADVMKELNYLDILNRWDRIMRERPRPSFRDDVVFLSGFLQSPVPLSSAATRQELYRSLRQVTESLV
ncbi:hypothetical protein [Luteolibacter sp.]|uniref:hypothetical protein n=1 Tax=Luteolibacter sp. TaxID=1962973 RepID=UPI0032677517